MLIPLIALKQVTAGYADQPIFVDLDLALLPGQFTAIVGPTGGGKTTLLKVILGLLPCASGAIYWPRPLTVGYVPQREAIDWYFPVTAQQVVLMGRHRQTNRWPWPSREDRRQAAALLERLGLAPYARQHISQLSGGQQQRVFLARALIGNPALLLLDEPTTGADIKTQYELLQLLQELNGEGMTILLTTHELNTVASRVPWVICFNRGLVAQGEPEAVLTPSLLRRTYDADLALLTRVDLPFPANRPALYPSAGQRGRFPSRPRRISRGRPR
jgi:zinc/manganese transport system ATP-binding protein/zinc transport system ATP-binding protein